MKYLFQMRFLLASGLSAITSFASLAKTPPPQDVRYIENERVKVGVDLLAGGAIMYVEDKKLHTGNMINYYDRGRQIQQSYYSGPRPFIGPNGEKPHKAWANLGWNPIQTGDVGGNASPVLSFHSTATNMTIRTAPMLWPHSGVRAECEFTTVIELAPGGFRYKAEIRNARSDKTDYGAAGQENPALYTNARWYKTVSYTGDKPWTGGAPAVVVSKNDGKGWPWRDYLATECWTALLDDAGTGIGVFNAECLLHASGFAGGDENKGRPLGPRDFPTGYIAPLCKRVLDHNATMRYEAFVAVGTLEEMRAAFAAEARKAGLSAGGDSRASNSPFYVFHSSRLGWTHENAVSTGYPLRGAYEVVLQKPGAAVASPLAFTPAAGIGTVELEASARGGGKPLECVLELVPFSPLDTVDYPHWSTEKENVQEYLEKAAKRFPRLPPVAIPFKIPADGRCRTFKIEVPAPRGFRAYKQFRLTFPSHSGETFSMRRFRAR